MARYQEEDLFKHFAGSALGTFIGDAMGMPVEGWSSAEIQQHHGMLCGLSSGRFPLGSYTDDTEMTIGLLESLVKAGEFTPKLAADRFLENYHPYRGYGGRIQGIMDRLAEGESWETVGTDSYGNGSAMRVSPVGFFYFNDLDAAAEFAAVQASITHRHPEALGGAVMQALAVAQATEAGLKGRFPDRTRFLTTLASYGRKHAPQTCRRVMDLASLRPGPITELIPRIQERFACNVRAAEAVGPAIAAFLYTDSFRKAVTLAVNLGGDTDTIGAMAGAMAGAYYGVSGLPREWIAPLENGEKGCDYVLTLARRAASWKYYSLARS